jgi:hypothetical protein
MFLFPTLLVLGLAGVAWAQDETKDPRVQIQELKEQLFEQQVVNAQLRARLAEVQAALDSYVLSARAEELKKDREVLDNSVEVKEETRE